MTDVDLRWTKLGSEAGPDLPLFRVPVDTMRHPTSSVEFERMVLETQDWVNIIAITTEGLIVMVEQYLFGVGDHSAMCRRIRQFTTTIVIIG